MEHEEGCLLRVRLTETLFEVWFVSTLLACQLNTKDWCVQRTWWKGPDISHFIPLCIVKLTAFTDAAINYTFHLHSGDKCFIYSFCQFSVWRLNFSFYYSQLKLILITNFHFVFYQRNQIFMGHYAYMSLDSSLVSRKTSHEVQKTTLSIKNSLQWAQVH